MFLKRLFNYNRFLFIVVIGFIIGSLLINLKWGMTVYPMIHYGMYSGKQFLSDTIIIHKPVVISEYNLKLSDLSSYQRECLHFYYDNYTSSKLKLDAIQSTMERKFKVHPHSNFKFPNESDLYDFQIAYQKKNLNMPIDSIFYIKEKYIFQKNKIRIIP